MLMLLVLEAKMAPGSAASVSAIQVSRLSGSSSKTASMTMSWPVACAGTGRGADPRQDLIRRGLLQLALGDLATQVAGDAALALLRQLAACDPTGSPTCRRRR